jgi:hypothetical protein
MRCSIFDVRESGLGAWGSGLGSPERISVSSAGRNFNTEIAEVLRVLRVEAVEPRSSRRSGLIAARGAMVKLAAYGTIEGFPK